MFKAKNNTLPPKFEVYLYCVQVVGTVKGKFILSISLPGSHKGSHLLVLYTVDYVVLLLHFALISVDKC